MFEIESFWNTNSKQDTLNQQLFGDNVTNSIVVHKINTKSRKRKKETTDESSKLGLTSEMLSSAKKKRKRKKKKTNETISDNSDSPNLTDAISVMQSTEHTKIKHDNPSKMETLKNVTELKNHKQCIKQNTPVDDNSQEIQQTKQLDQNMNQVTNDAASISVAKRLDPPKQENGVQTSKDYENEGLAEKPTDNENVTNASVSKKQNRKQKQKQNNLQKQVVLSSQNSSLVIKDSEKGNTENVTVPIPSPKLSKKQKMKMKQNNLPKQEELPENAFVNIEDNEKENTESVKAPMPSLKLSEKQAVSSENASLVNKKNEKKENAENIKTPMPSLKLSKKQKNKIKQNNLSKQEESLKNAPLEKECNEKGNNTVSNTTPSIELAKKQKKKIKRKNLPQQEELSENASLKKEVNEIKNTESVSIPMSNLKPGSSKLPVATQSKYSKFQNKLFRKLEGGQFRWINEKLYTSESCIAMDMFCREPTLFDVYHKGFQSQVQGWPENPVDVVISYIESRDPSLVVADFGCGDAKLSRSVKNKVHSFDLVAANESVTACDMRKVPLEEHSVDIAVFCLSLMGTNLVDFILEAKRVLQLRGTLLIAEVKSRFESIDDFVNTVSQLGFTMMVKNDTNKMFVLLEFEKTEDTLLEPINDDIVLKPCIYKRR